jgi:hypothetical protein
MRQAKEKRLENTEELESRVRTSLLEIYPSTAGRGGASAKVCAKVWSSDEPPLH